MSAAAKPGRSRRKFTSEFKAEAVSMVAAADGNVATILSHLPYTIVGAGVSTCAPVIIG